MRVALLACLLLGAASAHADSWQFQCDGTDPLLLAEIEQAFESGVGYGETWDETVCNQGLMVLGEGVRLPKTPEQIAAASEAKAAKAAAAAAEAARIEAEKPKLTPLQQKMEDQFFALFIPVFVFFAGGFAVLLAAVIVVLLRTRKQIVVDVSCPSCQMRIPFVVGESPHLFCPSCGGACRVSVETTGKSHSALAIPL